jgi:hypothetical protein
MSEKTEVKNIYQALAAVMKEVGAIGKNQKNAQQKFNFRGIDDVYNHVQPLMAKHGVFSVPTVLNERTEDRQTRSGGNLIYRILTIKYTFYAEDGTSVEAMDSGDKGANKAMAVGHKYALLQVLSIPTEDMPDPDSETPTMKESDLGPRQQPQAGPENFQSDTLSDDESLNNVRNAFKVLPERGFEGNDGYAHLAEVCNDLDYLKEILKNLGATSSKHITYDIYKKALGILSKPRVFGKAQ